MAMPGRRMKSGTARDWRSGAWAWEGLAPRRATARRWPQRSTLLHSAHSHSSCLTGWHKYINDHFNNTIKQHGATAITACLLSAAARLPACISRRCTAHMRADRQAMRRALPRSRRAADGWAAGGLELGGNCEVADFGQREALLPGVERQLAFRQLCGRGRDAGQQAWGVAAGGRGEESSGRQGMPWPAKRGGCGSSSAAATAAGAARPKTALRCCAT